MSFVKKNVLKTNKAAGVAESKDPNIIIVYTKDILTFPDRDSGKVKMISDIVLKEGAYSIKIYATPSSIKPTKTSDGEEDSKGFMHGTEFAHPGDSLEINEAIADLTNENVIILQRTGCTNNFYYKVYGTPCAPLQLKLEGQNDFEATKNIFKFEATVKNKYLPGFYFGSVTFDEPMGVIVDGDTEINFTGSGEYRIIADGLEVSGINGGNHGDVISIVGYGNNVDVPFLDPKPTIFLKDGADWYGNQGEILTLKAFKNSEDGDLIWIEQSRT
ncbi:hypothetical protein [Aureivirga marina]|uniref:hypothetical protein n=1 Tax=Aureivirga marina TaxID=1182451 RepID=UPI0018CB5C62|nr:hypothetical protein [Aureivirga marina]